MDAISCIKGRRSVRRFEDRPVSHELLEQIIETASYAPSWKNTQVARYIALEGDAKEKLSHCTTIWEGNGNIIRNAPMVIALCMVTGRSGYERDGSFSTSKKDGWQMFDTGIASEAFCLAAYEAGLGTVILGLYDDNAAEVIGVPEGQELVALIPIGYPAEEPTAPKRKGVTDLLSYRE
ncbi:MAG: nitroreductase family protein [Lachnospiraceae bacterium]|nr:nitroreductase family protein [Lachnospiraceae bacterium]